MLLSRAGHYDEDGSDSDEWGLSEEEEHDEGLTLDASHLAHVSCRPALRAHMRLAPPRCSTVILIPLRMEWRDGPLVAGTASSTPAGLTASQLHSAQPRLSDNVALAMPSRPCVH